MTRAVSGRYIYEVGRGDEAGDVRAPTVAAAIVRVKSRAGCRAWRLWSARTGRVGEFGPVLTAGRLVASGERRRDLE